MVCLGILWNGMQEHLNEVMKDISCYGEIIDSFSMNLGEKYEKFVRDIYSQDDIASWKVDKKLETMFKCSDVRMVTVVFIDIDATEMVYHPLKKRMVFINLENMKTEMRKKYSQLVKCYFFDNVFHVTDNEHEYNADFRIVNQYCDSGIEKSRLEFKNPHVKVLRKDENRNET